MILKLFEVRESDKMQGLLSIILLLPNKILINSIIQEHEC